LTVGMSNLFYSAVISSEGTGMLLSIKTGQSHFLLWI